MGAYLREVGLDEVGRGAWAGPVVVGAARGDRGAIAEVLASRHGVLRDSKALSPAGRQRALRALHEQGAAIALGCASAAEVDLLGLRAALALAARRALAQAQLGSWDLVVLDGSDPYVTGVPVRCVVGGDRSDPLVAAASVAAKVARDAMMEEFALRWPCYGFDRHKGYGTALHRAALVRWGPCPQHRRSVAPVSALLDDYVCRST